MANCSIAKPLHSKLQRIETGAIFQKMLCGKLFFDQSPYCFQYQVSSSSGLFFTGPQTANLHMSLKIAMLCANGSACGLLLFHQDVAIVIKMLPLSSRCCHCHQDVAIVIKMLPLSSRCCHCHQDVAIVTELCPHNTPLQCFSSSQKIDGCGKRINLQTICVGQLGHTHNFCAYMQH